MEKILAVSGVAALIQFCKMVFVYDKTIPTSPGPPVVLVPHQRVPVDAEHRGRAQERPQVLAGQVVGHLSPGKLSHTGIEYF